MDDRRTLLRDLIFGRGRYARDGAPEPTLLPLLLKVAAPDLVARVALSGDAFRVAELHPELRTELLSTIASRVGELPREDRAALLERAPALIQYLPEHLLPEAAAVAAATHDDALRALVRLKLLGRGKSKPETELAAVRSLLKSGGGATPWRYGALLEMATHTEGTERFTLIDELAGMPDFGAQADFVAGVAKLLPSKARADLLDLWLREAPSLGQDLGSEWECWALTRIAPLLPEKEYAHALRGALQAAHRLPPPWQRAGAIRELRRALDGLGVKETVRLDIGHELHSLVPVDEPWRSHLHGYIDRWLKGARPAERKPADEPAPSAQVFADDLRELLAAAPVVLDARENLQQVLGDGLGAALGRWSGRTAAARPPSPAEARPDAFPRMIEEFDLGVGRGPKARPPDERAPARGERPRNRVVSTGFAEPPVPGGSHDRRRPLLPGERYYYWLEIGRIRTRGAIDVGSSILPEEIPAEAELAVVLFAPDGGFDLPREHELGRLRLLPGGTARIVAQPASQYEGASAELLEKRLLFPLRAPPKAGRYRLRSNIYCQGVLVQSRLVEAHVGQAPARGPAVVSKVDYTLTRALAPDALRGIEAHGLSVMLNRNANGNHDFLFYGGATEEPFHPAVTISADTLHGAITQARSAMRKVSWGDEGEYAPKKPNRYKQPRALDDFRVDLTRLAARGYDIYDLVVHNLAEGDVAALERALKSPGVLQIAGKEDIRFVLPAGVIYDYPLDNQARPIEQYDLCPAFADAFRKGTPLSTTRCFQGECASRGQLTTVCPSGFWGFRHAIGLPVSLGNARDAGELAPRLKYRDVPVIVVAVSTAPDLPAREDHQEDLRKLRNEWAERGWWLGDSREEVLDLLATSKPHLVYFYCHGGVTERGGLKVPYLSVGPLSEPPIVRSNVGARVVWDDPRPLVFINGCHTTALDADTTLDFVTGFVQRSHACGVIGTEITVFESLAGAFAKAFWRLFLTGQVGAGEAVRLARLELLQAGNPLGLVYTPFVLAGTKLEKIA